MANVFSLGGGSGLASAGSGKGLYCVELPRSLYYGQAAEWNVASTANPLAQVDLQVVCNGELWVVSSASAYNQPATIYSRSLATKEVTYTGSFTLPGRYINPPKTPGIFPIATDGESRIWFLCADNDDPGTSTATINIYINEFNVLTKELKKYAGWSFSQSSSTYSPGSTFCCGAIHYSKACNKVFFIGFASGRRTGSNTYQNMYNNIRILDLATGVVSNGCAISWGINNAYTYEKDGYIYIGGGFKSYYASKTSYAVTTALSSDIARYSIAENVFSIIKSDFNQNIDDLGNGTTAVFVVGDAVMQITASNTFVFNPITGSVIEGQLPSPYGTDITIKGRCQAIYNNVLYLWTHTADKALLEMTLWEDTPADAPIVAKIYKGQKYHALVPFSLLRQGIEVTTQQQEATEDIEIKMYDYSSEGGQLLYIETT